MNFSVNDVSQARTRDLYSTAVTKNVILVALYFSINYINGSLVHTFIRHEIFYENPRYILFIHMVVNDILQLTVAVVINLISYTFYTVSVSLCCFLVIIAVFTTLNTPLSLASMAVERYIAICNPLRHAQICTVRRTYRLIGLIWVVGAISIFPDLFYLFATQPIGFFNSNIFCNRDTVFFDPNLIQKKNVSFIVFLSFVFLTVVYTYCRVAFTARAAGSGALKARNTILLHGLQLLLCIFTFIGPFLEGLLISRFPASVHDLRFVSYVFVHILPRFISPIVYGLRDQMFCTYLKRHLLCDVQRGRIKRKTRPF